MKTVRLAVLVGSVLGLGLIAPVDAATFYLDGQLSSNCSGNYSIANRNCNGSDGNGYASLQAALNALSPGDTMVIRPGQYWRNPGGLELEPGMGGSASAWTKVTTLAGEERQAVICTAAGKCQRNPNPGCGGGGSGCSTGNQYYPEPAIVISDDFIEVSNLKTYGQTCMLAPNILVQNNDLEGGGPSRCVQAANQGMVVAYKGSDSSSVLRNNLIHWSTDGESSGNGACVMGYDGTLLVENNTIYDCNENGVRFKDQQPAPLNDPTVVRRNFFRRNTDAYVAAGGGSSGGGLSGCTQNCGGIGQHRYYQNIFVDLLNAIPHDQFGAEPALIYNNTFVSMSGYEIGWWAGADRPIHAYNNLHYTDEGTKVIDNETSTGSHQFDWNCYATSGGSFSWATASGTYGSLGQWQNQGQDANGRTVNPNFANLGCLASNDCTPEDFKRTSYQENMSGSPYGNRCGAYQTGNEVIGVDWSIPGPSCGNGVIEGTEVCDGGALGGQTCSSQGFTGGTLACQSGCGAFDTSGCSNSSSPPPQVQGLQFVN